MNRRELLEWVSRGLAAGIAAVVGIPGVRYFLDGVPSESAGKSEFTRLIRLSDLSPGRPTIVPVIGRKQDAWTCHDQQTIGRVWLVREESDSDGEFTVRAMSSVCPHMGCQLQAQSGCKGFVCPCHRAAFGVDGTRLPDPRSGDRNHAPRDLDRLDCRLVQDEGDGDQWIEVKYERFETGREQRVVRT